MKRIIRTFVTVMIVLCFAVNVSFAADNPLTKWFRLEMKDPEKAYQLSLFPGLLLPGTPHFYLGDVAGGILKSGADFFSIMYVTHIYAYIGKSNDFLEKFICLPFLLAPVAYLAYGRYENLKYIEKKTKEWNNAVRNIAYDKIKNDYKKNALFYTGLGGIVLIGGLFLNNPGSALAVLPGSNSRDVLVLGGTFIVSGAAYFLQRKHLDDKIFSRKGIPPSRVMVFPMIYGSPRITGDRGIYSGIMLVRKF